VDLPVAWTDAVGDSLIDTGGISAAPLAAGAAGEVIAVRDNGSNRDVLLISPEGLLTPIYAVPDPDQNDARVAALDDRSIVIGVQHSPRGANGIIPMVERIDVIDQRGAELRTAAQTSEQDRLSGGATIDSLALFEGKVYWITRDAFSSMDGTLKSYGLADGTVSEVASGTMADVRATAAGLTWDVGWGPDGTATEVKIAAALPAEVAAAVGTGPGRLSLTTDGTVYAWLDPAGPDLMWWSPDSGLTRVSGDLAGTKHRRPDMWVAGPYVMIGTGISATVVDIRSGAVADLGAPVVDVNGGTIAIVLPKSPGGGKLAPTMPGMIRSQTLPPLTC
jgi:hypothetical protein